jgi:predicted RNA-binding protein YlxR (DUF448 family)
MLTDDTKTTQPDDLTVDQNTDLAAPDCAVSDDAVDSDAPLSSHTTSATPACARPPKETSRRCIATKQSYERDEMIRFVLSPDNIVTPDLDENLPGRGAWIKTDKAALQNAIKGNLFAKSFKSQAVIPEDMLERLSEMLNQRCLNALNLARRSGDCVVGFDKAIIAAKKLSIALYITGSEEGSDSRRKIENALSDDAKIISLWDADTLSKNFGTDNTNHIVIKRSGIANKIIKEYRKLYAVIV